MISSSFGEIRVGLLDVLVVDNASLAANVLEEIHGGVGVVKEVGVRTGLDLELASKSDPN
jgi:hypothetical protein